MALSLQSARLTRSQKRSLMSFSDNAIGHDQASQCPLVANFDRNVSSDSVSSRGTFPPNATRPETPARDARSHWEMAFETVAGNPSDFSSGGFINRRHIRTGEIPNYRYSARTRRVSRRRFPHRGCCLDERRRGIYLLRMNERSFLPSACLSFPTRVRSRRCRQRRDHGFERHFQRLHIV